MRKISTKGKQAYPLRDYNAANAMLATAKNVAAGKPLASSGFRLFRGDDMSVDVHVHNVKIGSYLPNNTFVFTLSDQQMRRMSTTLSQSLQKALPFLWVRKATSQYRVMHYSKPFTWECWKKAKAKGADLYEGLCFDLGSGEPINPVKRHVMDRSAYDKDARKKWLGYTKRYRAKVNALHKLGALEKYPFEHIFHRPIEADEVYDQLVDETGPTDEFIGKVAGHALYWVVHQEPVAQANWLRDKLLSLVRNNSVQLRRRMGVLG